MTTKKTQKDTITRELQAWSVSELIDFMQENNQKEPIHVTEKHGGKMSQMFSISTSPLCNPYCQARYNNNSKKKIPIICAWCFAHRQLERYVNNQPILEYNTTVLKKIIPIDFLPFIAVCNYKNYFRFESFGDLNNVEQVINYFNICKKNQHINFALWTKNYNFIAVAINKYGYKKPANLQIIGSVAKINPSENEKAELLTRYDFINKTFSVYDSDTKANINCGGKKCIECGFCYDKKYKNIKHINELIK